MNMRDWKLELTGRVLVLVAHADDESVAYGGLLQKMREAVVVIATDGAPRDEYFWGRYGSRENYAAVRRDEARRAAQVAGVRELVLLAEEDGRFEDQRLFLNLASAYERVAQVAERVRPEAITTLAYEGGHPDHDCCSALAARLGSRLGVPVWETAVYSRLPEEIRLQEFVCANGSEARVEISTAELERKRAMCAQYVSQQGELLQSFDLAREVVRPQVRYEYARAPHEGPTNYECWEWWMSAREVSARLAEFVESGR